MERSIVFNVLRVGAIAVLPLLVMGATGAVAFAQTTPPASAWSILNAPGANATYPMGISGNNIVGQYSDGIAGPYGFLYDGTSWTTLNRPGAAWTVVAGISGGNMVGYSSTGNFLFDGISWTTINKAPGATWTNVYGIDGNNIVGSYGDNAEGWHGFIYNATADTWTTLDFPGAISTTAYGMNGNNVVGIYDEDTSGMSHGFLYDGITWTTLDFPGANWTHPYSISDNNIVGVYDDGYGYQGFLYNGTSWITLNFNNERNGTQTQAFGISGNNIVGAYNDASGMHGFLVNILTPTPTITLSPIADQIVTVGQTVTFIATAIDSDPEGVITYFYAASTTASNTATIDPLSGAFSWDTTEVTPDVYSFNVQATGSTGGYAIYNVFITVVLPPPPAPSQNQPPTLSFPTTDPYAGDGIDPNSGDTTTEFTFRVIYTDADNNPPSFINTLLFGHATTTVPMEVDALADPALHDGDYANGEQYAATARREVFGTHYYAFEASDGTQTIQLWGVSPLEISSPVPTNKDQCKNSGWKTFTNLYFKNQGQCVSYVQANEKAKKH